MHELTPNQSLLATGSNELLIAKAIQRNERYYVSLYGNHPPWSWLNPKWVVAEVDTGKTDFALAAPWKKNVILEVCHPPPSAPQHFFNQFCNTQRLIEVRRSAEREWKCSPLCSSMSDLAAFVSHLSVAPRWWRITTARQITPTPAWCRSLCTTLRPCCAARRILSPTGSSCWGSHTCRAS